MQLRRLDLFSSGADEEWLSGGNALDCVCQGEARWLRAWSGRRQPVVGEWLDRRQQILGWVVTNSLRWIPLKFPVRHNTRVKTNKSPFRGCAEGNDFPSAFQRQQVCTRVPRPFIFLPSAQGGISWQQQVNVVAGNPSIWENLPHRRAIIGNDWQHSVVTLQLPSSFPGNWSSWGSTWSRAQPAWRAAQEHCCELLASRAQILWNLHSLHNATDRY